MNIYNRLFYRFPKLLSVIFLLSLFIIFLQYLFLFDMPEAFPKAHELGIITNRIFLSFISGISIYYFAHYIPKRQKADATHLLINNYAWEIQEIMRDLLRLIYMHHGESFIDRDDYRTIEAIRSRITRGFIDNPIVFPYNSIEYQDLMHLVQYIKNKMTEIHIALAPFLDVLPMTAVENLSNIIEVLNVRINPEIKISTNTTLSVDLFSNHIFTMTQNAYRFKQNR